jgi:F-type H+-transporting ATPase subunit epsilon
MAATFQVRILTAETTALEAQIVHLRAPGSEGFLGVLAHHAPLITTLRPGPLRLDHPDGRREVLAVSGGFLEVADNQAVVLADALETPEEIDLARAEAARERAERRLRRRPEGLDVARAEAALQRALNRIRLAREHGR